MSAFLSVADIAKVLGWRTERARRWLLRSGAAIRIGGFWYTTPERLRSEFPELLDAVCRNAATESREAQGSAEKRADAPGSE